MEPFQLEANNLYTPLKQAETPLQHGQNLYSSQAVAGRFQSVGDVAHARHFFAPVTDVKSLALHTTVPGLEQTSMAAAKAVSQTISPMLQLIMRLPTHMSIFSSFLDALKSFLLPHTDIFSQLATHMDASGLGHLSQSLFSLNGHHAVAWSIMPSHADIFRTMAFDSGNIGGMARLHLSPTDSLKHSMNVSAGVDLQHPQFEQLSPSSASNEMAINGTGSTAGDTLSGPGISSQSITPQLAPAERIFSSKYLESPITSQINSGTNLIASSQNIPSNNIASASLPPSFNQQPVSTNVADTSSLSQSPSSNDVLDSPPLEGMHAKELSFANFHHSAHSAVAHSSHPVLAQSQAHLKTNTNHSASNSSASNSSINHKHLGHEITPQGISSAPESAAVSQTGTNIPYTIKSGDTLWQIARDQLGDGTRWYEIYNLNSNLLGSNPNLIYSGTSIHLPQSDQNLLPGTDNSAIASQVGSGHYTVKGGDDLWHISQNLLGGGQHWPDLYKMNGDIIGGNPSMIFSGQKFDLPAASHLAGSTPAHSVAANSGGLHQPLPKVEPQVQAAHETLSSNVNHTQDQIIHTTEIHTQPAHAVLASHFKLMPENTIMPDPSNHISMHTASNNGLSIESAHDRLLSGAGSAQASGIGHNSAISKAANNLAAGKTKSVVSFSLTPDLSCLSAVK